MTFNKDGESKLVRRKMKFGYPRDVRFKCLKCALCCGDTESRARSILLLKLEADRISQKTSKVVDDFAERIKGFEPYIYRMKKHGSGKCVFLEANMCTIYQIRPLICMFYPFELEEVRRNRYAFSYADECPAIGKGPCLTKSYFERLFQKFVKIMEANKENSK